MKILMINVCCGTGSTGRICTDLATSLDKLGHTVKIAYGRDSVNPEFQKYAVKIGTYFDIYNHVLKSMLLDASGFGSVRSTRKFIDWVEDYSPDIIHLHNIHGYYIHIPTLFNYLKKCGKPIIWTLHDSWAFTGHSVYCEASNCERWRDGCYNCPQLSTYPHALFDNSKKNWLIKKELFSSIPNLIIVTPSYWLKGLVQKSFLSDYKTYVIHNGIDTSYFEPTDSLFRNIYNIENKKIVLGVSTSWDNMKGLSDFYKLRDILDTRYVIVLVGLTKKQIKKLPKGIIGIEKTDSVKELVEIYSSSDVLVVLSKVENFPTVNIEAMSCGIPVVSYDVGGSKESILNSGGIVVPKGNINAIAEAVTKIEKKVFFNKSIFDRTKTAEEYLKLYKNI